MVPAVRNAIARVDVIQNGHVVSRGTGFLVAKGLVLTAMHVVADRTKEFLSPYPGDITLTFPGINTRGVISHWNQAADWALLRCELPSAGDTHRPLSVAEPREEADQWETFGFPDANPEGIVFTGKITNRWAKLENQPVFQLYCLEAAAGTGAPVRGLSGAPVLVQKAARGHNRKDEFRWVVVGVLRSSLMKEQSQETVAGTMYACPVTSIMTEAGNLLQPPDPSASEKSSVEGRAPSSRRVSRLAAALLSAFLAIGLGVLVNVSTGAVTNLIARFRTVQPTTAPIKGNGTQTAGKQAEQIPKPSADQVSDAVSQPGPVSPGADAGSSPQKNNSPPGPTSGDVTPVSAPPPPLVSRLMRVARNGATFMVEAVDQQGNPVAGAKIAWSSPTYSNDKAFVNATENDGTSMAPPFYFQAPAAFDFSASVVPADAPMGLTSSSVVRATGLRVTFAHAQQVGSPLPGNACGIGNYFDATGVKWTCKVIGSTVALQSVDGYCRVTLSNGWLGTFQCINGESVALTLMPNTDWSAIASSWSGFMLKQATLATPATSQPAPISPSKVCGTGSYLDPSGAKWTCTAASDTVRALQRFDGYCRVTLSNGWSGRLQCKDGTNVSLTLMPNTDWSVIASSYPLFMLKQTLAVSPGTRSSPVPREQRVDPRLLR